MTADPGPGSGGHTARPAAFLPGPVPDRETLEGWTRWRVTRRDFVPAPVITAAGHARMTPRQRRLHDLHRVATHSNLAIQETPMSSFVSRQMRSLIETGAFCHGPDTRPGLMINGGACQGKTETACEALACFEDEWLTTWCTIRVGACWPGGLSCWWLPLGGAVGDQAGDGRVGFVEVFASSEVALEDPPLLVLGVGVLHADPFR